MTKTEYRARGLRGKDENPFPKRQALSTAVLLRFASLQSQPIALELDLGRSIGCGRALIHSLQENVELI